MAKNFKYEYKQHVRNTAPDMDKLWNRIESEIDKTDRREGNTENSSFSYIRQTKKYSGFNQAVAVAAACMVLAAGISIVKNQRTPEADDGISSDSITETVDNNDTSSSENQAEDNDISPSEDEAENNEQSSGEQMVLYEQLSLSETSSPVYCGQFTPAGDEYFVERKVLEQTDYFADVTVEQADISSAKEVSYVLTVNRLISKYGEENESSITLTCTSPYILQQNREYLIPLKYQDGQWSMVFENAPQIEITLNREIVFQNGWESLDEGSQWVKKDKVSEDDFYYDRMRYSSEDDLQRLFNSWYET